MSTSVLHRLFRDEEGAVTVDWVVLTAGLIVFGVIAASSIISGSTGMSGSIGATLGSAPVPEIDFNQVD